MSYRDTLIAAAPPALTKPGEKFKLGRKFVEARRTMRAMKLPHIAPSRAEQSK